MTSILTKTVVYRITASTLAQLISYVLFQRIEINAAVLFADLVQTVYYYLFETGWGKFANSNKKKSEGVRKR